MGRIGELVLRLKGLTASRSSTLAGSSGGAAGEGGGTLCSFDGDVNGCHVSLRLPLVVVLLSLSW
jgi:hypothetical protein